MRMGADCREFEGLFSRNTDQQSGFARCCGAIDGTFIRIKQPVKYAIDGGNEHNSALQKNQACNLPCNVRVSRSRFMSLVEG